MYDLAEKLIPLLRRAVELQRAPTVDAALDLIEELELLELIAPPYKATVGARVYAFLKAWRDTPTEFLSLDFHRRARAILALDAQACEKVSGYVVPGRVPFS